MSAIKLVIIRDFPMNRLEVKVDGKHCGFITVGHNLVSTMAYDLHIVFERMIDLLEIENTELEIESKH